MPNIQFMNASHLMNKCIKRIHKITPDRFDEESGILQLLFNQNPALVNSRNPKHGCTPLHIATVRNFRNEKQLEFIKMLLKNKADVNAKDKNDCTPLHYSVRGPVLENAMDIMHLLISNGANPYAVTSKRANVLHVASEYFPPNLFLDLVIFFVGIGKTNLFTAIMEGNYTLLHTICLFPQSEVSHDTLDILKSNGVDFNAICAKQLSAFHLAIVRQRSERFLKALIKFGADVNCKYLGHFSSLHMAAQVGNYGAVKLLVSLGMDVNSRDDAGNTPLHHVFFEEENNEHEIVYLLLKNNANVYANNLLGQSQIDLAVKRLEDGLTEQRTVELLKSYAK